MFYYIEGTVTVTGPNLAVIDTGGVGYCCYTTLNTLSRIEKGKRARLYTYCDVKEDAFNIYGFADEREKRCFEQLLSVSGVGPKGAASILSSATPEDVAMAVVTEDEKVFTAAQGIGKRIAQRIILELKDKIQKENDIGASSPVVRPAGGDPEGQKLADVAAALTVLGYSTPEINAALRGMDIKGKSVEEIIRLVLKGSVKEG